jgi:hypothetical protein
MQHTTETVKQYQCRHIFTDGRRCSSPCLRQEEFCYYHHTTRKPAANPKQRRSRCSTFHLPLPEDRSAIQSSIGEVLQRIAANDIDPRRAGLLLYGLQIASLNLPKQQNTQRHARPEPVETVEEITIDPTLGVLAPRAEVSGITKPRSVVTQLIERSLRSEKEEPPAQEPSILPTLNAESATTSPHRHKGGCPTSRFWDVGFTSISTHPKKRQRNLKRCHSDHHPNKQTVISTGGGEPAAAVEKSACCLCRCLFSSTPPKNRNCHFNRRANALSRPASAYPSKLSPPRFPEHRNSKIKIPQHSHSLKPPAKTTCIL